MQIVTDFSQYDKKPCAATIGSFDGVHKGHLAMLGELRAAATAKGLPLMVVTFARHPRMLFSDACAPFLLTPLAAKLHLLESAVVDICVLLDFDRTMSATVVHLEDCPLQSPQLQTWLHRAGNHRT